MPTVCIKRKKGDAVEPLEISPVDLSSTAPKAPGTASAGSSGQAARADHVHPVQTTISGNAGSATKLATARTISLSGDVTGSVSFNGAANAGIKATLKNAAVLHSASGARTAAIAANAAFTVPSYVVGSGRLQVYLDGLLCAGGSDAAACAYTEVGTAGAASTSIKFHQSIPVDMEIIARVQ